MSNMITPKSMKWGLLALGGAAMLILTGCQTAEPSAGLTEAAATAMSSNSVRLNPGDVVQINFPAATAMSTTERVRLDGKLYLPLVGEVAAAGKTPAELQSDLVNAYGKQLQVKEVVVIVNSSSASIFVTGAVNRPGKVQMERPMTVLDAIMEAGGFDPKRANMKKVALIRQSQGRYSRQTLNMKPVLKGENVTPFKLQPFDVVFVPEKIF